MAFCSWLRAAGGTKITSFDPPLPAIRTAYPSEPFQAWPVLFDPALHPVVTDGAIARRAPLARGPRPAQEA
jgi:hypothetical protein